MIPEAPLPLDSLLLHQTPLRLLDGIREVSAERCIAWTEVSPAAWYADAEGAMPAWFGLELMAQAVSAYSGAQKTAQGRPLRVGLLLGTQSYLCSLPAFPAGSILDIDARLHYFDGSGVSAFRCELRRQDEVIAHATLKVYEEP